MNNNLNDDRHEGYLKKWTNYVKQYQNRWFIYEKGLLTYFRDRSEVGQIAKGAIHLKNCKLKQNSCLSFSIIKNEWILNLRADSKENFDKWLFVIGNAIIECNQSINKRLSVSNSTNTLFNEFATQINIVRENINQINISVDFLSKKIFSNFQTNFELFQYFNSFNDLNHKLLNSVTELLRKGELLNDTFNYWASPDIKTMNPQNFSNSDNSDNSDFFDAVQETPQRTLFSSIQHVRSVSDLSHHKIVSNKTHRNTVPPRPNHKLNLWSLISNMIGKDITKVPLPVNFNEPLSSLQRYSETLENSDLLDKAACCDDPLYQMCYVVSFVISNYYSTSFRTNKPFNPLLGETFEYDRTEDLGWRCISEQVSHHPPICTIHAEGNGWLLWETYDVKSRFMPTYLEIQPQGLSQLQFVRTGFKYSWNKVTTYVNNIIMGKLRIEHSGKLVVKNHSTGVNACVEFMSEGWLSSKDARKIEGFVKDADGERKYAIKGYWNKFVEVYKLMGSEQQTAIDRKILWSGRALPKDAERMYHFSEFACSLNEEDESVAPTDSRRRPDQRAMEKGDFDLANKIKQELEEFQRKRRKQIIEDAIAKGTATKDTTIEQIQQPMWFKIDSSVTHESCPIFSYKGGYWEAKLKQDFSNCPNIFEYNSQ